MDGILFWVTEIKKRGSPIISFLKAEPIHSDVVLPFSLFKAEPIHVDVLPPFSLLKTVSHSLIGVTTF